jgi:hypothetical protein
MELAKFPRAHLVAGGWYLDRSRGFVPEFEEALYSSLVSSTPEVIKLEEESEEDENPAPPPIVKEVGSAKGKGKKKEGCLQSGVDPFLYKGLRSAHSSSSSNYCWKSIGNSFCHCS